MNIPTLLQTVYNNEPNLLEQVQGFIDRGADLSAVTKYCESPLTVASNNGRFDVVWALLEAGADSSQLRWTPSFYQVAFGTADELKASLYEHGDIEARDLWERTPLLMAIQVGDIPKADLLLELGADRCAVGSCGKPPFFYAIQRNNTEMMKWLLGNGFPLEATDQYSDTPLHFAAEMGMTESAAFLLEQGVDIYRQNDIPYRPIEVAANLDIVWMLVAEGEDINDIDEEMHALLTGTAVNEEPVCSKQEYVAAKHRRYGRSNPELYTPKFWRAMITSGATAWHARSKFDNSDYGNDQAVWCYNRFGRTTTKLDDGRIIEIAGEHEDHYDPDFCIYNDVVCFGKEGEIEIYNYPEAIFPPTDFHTSTLVGNRIYIIGSLGYAHSRRPDYTPVFILYLDSMKIERLETTGESPGWISHHKARLVDNKRIEIVGGMVWIDAGGDRNLLVNRDNYHLDLQTLTWHRTPTPCPSG